MDEWLSKLEVRVGLRVPDKAQIKKFVQQAKRKEYWIHAKGIGDLQFAIHLRMDDVDVITVRVWKCVPPRN